MSGGGEELRGRWRADVAEGTEDLKGEEPSAAGVAEDEGEDADRCGEQAEVLCEDRLEVFSRAWRGDAAGASAAAQDEDRSRLHHVHNGYVRDIFDERGNQES